MAEQNMVIKMLLDANNYDKGMAQAQKSVQGFINQNMSLGSVLSTAGKALGALGAAAGVAGSALEAAKRTIGATQTLTDAFGRSMEGAKAAVDSFFYSIASGNFDDFNKGLRDTIKYAKEAYDVLDDLGTFNIFAGAQGAEIKQQREELKQQIKTGYRYSSNDDGTVERIKMTDEEVNAAKEKLKQVQAEYIALIKATAEKEQESYTKLARQILSTNKFGGNAKQMDEAVDRYMRTYGSYSEAQDRYNELTKAGESIGAVEALGGIIQYSKYGFNIENLSKAKQEEYRQLEALLQIGDENLKKLMQHRINVAMANATMSAELRGDERVLASGGNGGGGGAEGVSGPMNNRFRSGPFADTNRFAKMSEEEMAAAADEVEDFVIEEEALLDEATAKLWEHRAAWREFVEDLNTNAKETGELLDGMAECFSKLGDVVGGTAGENIKAIGEFLTAAQGMIPVIQSVMMMQEAKKVSDEGVATSSMMAAAAQGGNAVAGVPLVGPALAIAAITSILGMVGAIKAIKFAEGGVVPGNNYTDGIQAKVSAGEVVMNQHDAKNLYDRIHKGDLGGGSGGGYVSGENIYIGLNNYLSRSGKGRLQVR